MKYEITSLNTKKLFAETLKSFMKKKPFSKISVSEIIKECGVNRKTFYYHFEDIMDLLKWTLEQETVKIIKNYDLLVDYEEAIIYTMDYVEANEYIINGALDSLGQEGIKNFFCNDFREMAYSVIQRAEEQLGKHLVPEFREYLSCFMSEALAGMFIEWIRNKKTRNRQQTIEYVVDIIQISVTAMIEQKGN